MRTGDSRIRASGTRPVATGPPLASASPCGHHSTGRGCRHFSMKSCLQGQSDATRPKQKALAAFLGAHARIVQVIQSKHDWAGPYCYIETNAGSGWNEKADCIGSPLVATEQFSQCQGLSYQCTFIEKHRESAELLDERLADDGFVVNGDHATALPSLSLPRNAFGLVYADPNALKDAPFTAMGAFFKKPEAQRIDALINVNAHAVYRVVAGQKAGNPGTYYDLPGIMRQVGKRHWWIRQPFSTPGNKWTFLFGSNNPKLNIKGLGSVNLPLFSCDSKQGAEILASLTGGTQPGKTFSSRSPYRTYRQYLSHPRFIAVRQQAMKRADGVCELCHQSRATEVHHRIYPAWGTFDHPDALVAICRACHCKAHGVTA